MSNAAEACLAAKPPVQSRMAGAKTIAVMSNAAEMRRAERRLVHAPAARMKTLADATCVRQVHRAEAATARALAVRGMNGGTGRPPRGRSDETNLLVSVA
jgi:hypothetical protein